ncbi:hydroxypyruvate reductase [Marinomonas ushuaiensis DSM 15871]|uniref:Hydroxypyruvate reductase n=1 Tax=Marinomonas ushuaiensis DSM 15871 TaxID=1122207 RepID=X7E9B8_9GAMM|nr:glyoxylate/hydroxypyruvate reductase A [Marinomonas ushuaiensis]ETX12532.1 hydroxypyruvate reductase [Marinomonas ushuaiensis DSM 15871]
MTMSILLASNDVDFSNAIKAELQQSYPTIQAYLPGEVGSKDAELAACWHPSDSLLVDYPNIKVLHALSAGVDHLGKKLLMSGLPICRIVDPVQKQGMLEYILWGILNYQRDFEQYRKFQDNKQWQVLLQRPASDTQISLLGLGEIGAYVAEKLAQFGYTVHGWSRSPKELIGVNCYHGEEGLNTVLSKAGVLVNLLPLNPHTQGILSQVTFNKMPENAYLINCGRGGHLVSEDLTLAIQSGHLTGALLDVFDEEPLPSDHYLWTTKGVIVTPHIASSSSLSDIVNQVVINMMLYQKGESLKNSVAT